MYVQLTVLKKQTAKNKHNRPVALFTPYCASAHIHTILRGNSITAIRLYLNCIIKTADCQYVLHKFFRGRKNLIRSAVQTGNSHSNIR